MSLPSDMLTVVSAGSGGPDVLKPTRAPLPQPSPEEVLIQVAAAGVNRPDVLQRSGDYPPPPGVTPVLGLEVAGVIADVGRDVTGWKVGDRVCALVIGGGYAEYCLAHSGSCLRVPKGLSLVEAAGVPETFFTVWTNMFDRGRLAAGDAVLVHGAASGIGTTAIQLARAFGARVFATAGSGAKCLACKRLGADDAFNYNEIDFVQAVKNATNGSGVNLILDVFGGDYFQRNVDALAEDGRLVQIAFRTGVEAQRRIVPVDFMPVILKRLLITGSTLKPLSAERKAAIATALHARVWPLIEEGKVKPVIDSVFPLAQARDAHVRMESGVHIGKIILQV